jgi:hypothetical protein
MAIAYQEMLERRKHKRFQVQDDAIAVLRPIVDKRGPIIDISRGGLAFRYITAKESLDRSLKLDILLPDLSFYLGHLPIRTVRDFEVTSEYALGSTKTRRCSVQFGKLTQKQISQIESFMVKHTRRLATS